MIHTVFYFGNPHISDDNAAVAFFANFKHPHFTFEKCDNPQELNEKGRNVIIADVVKGLQEVTLFDDIDDIVTRRDSSAHDLDVGFYLHLYKKMGVIDNAYIIGLPLDGPQIQKDAVDVVLKKIAVLLARK